MVCLLCFETSGDHINLSGVEGSISQISSIVYKYFQFMFESEPAQGEICRKCWIKVDMFHAFYQHIEEIQSNLIKSDPLVAENLDIKSEDTLSHMQKEESNNDTNYGLEFNDTHWNDDFDANQSDASTNSKRDIVTVEFSMNEPTEDKPAEDKPTEIKPIKSKVAKNKATTRKYQRKKSSKTSTNTSNQHTCPNSKCRRKFEAKDTLIAHCAQEHARFHCTHCPNIRMFADLYKHLRDVHEIVENAICEHCGIQFGCNRTLQEHIKRKHTVSDPVQCDICKEWFKSRETIRSHMIYVHIQGPQACGICGKVSANRKALRTHLTIHSEAWKKFKCVICDKGFRSSTKLREHSYIHSGKTDAYVCQFCGKSFRFNSSISAHRMKYHPAEMAHVKERLQRKRNMEFKV
ncbi:zinc finger protein 454-like isoform X2 [Contarinia nasturtii]|uniref:zinc finger protein 454-like isoform X2 n=1 Tax=Contarinia nasturtii TaxID=265458 RepID=UPI0012D4A724|nr:zinc finger protein 454-like isoform X2 [Contarinia nasturtii]